MGVFTYLDAIDVLPSKYEDFSITPLPKYPFDKERLVVYGTVESVPRLPVRTRTRTLTRFAILLEDGRRLEVQAWNRDYLSSVLKPGTGITVLGRYDQKSRALNLISYRAGKIPEDELLKAIHPLPDGLSEATFKGVLERAFTELLTSYVDPIPYQLREKYRLMGTFAAYREIHFPRDKKALFEAKRTLKYLDALTYEAMIVDGKDKEKKKRTPHERKIDLSRFKGFGESLPFVPTDDQKEATNAIYKDMASPFLMRRLLLGDVGSGKTLVAAMALYLNYSRGYQGAMLVPTETLARQHLETLTSLFEKTDLNIAYLSGSTSAKERKDILNRLKTGEIDVLVGTHAIFSKDVQYAGLKLAIVDEQHRFGVNQRQALLDKGDSPDYLAMTATPIPRSLAQAVYGNLEVSTLRSFPHGKRDVTTKIVAYKDETTQKMVRSALEHDRRVYVIAKEIHGDSPTSSAIEIYRRYKNLYGDKVVLITGESEPSEINDCLASFTSGATPILVATQVIEVGIDVKDAGLMVVYDASRFALSSLHQLRGRIGRDGRKAYILLLSANEDLEKLKVMEKTDDGFLIAEEDLKLRGPGDLFGTRQSGEIVFSILDPVEDLRILASALEDATSLKENDPEAFDLLIREGERKAKGRESLY